MLSAVILNSSTTLNNFIEIGALPFIPGAPFTFYVRLIQPQLSGLRYVADPAATMNMILPNKDGTDLTVAMTPLTGDFSIWSGTVTALQSEELASGNMTFDLNDNGTLIKGWIQNGLQLTVTGGC